MVQDDTVRPGAAGLLGKLFAWLGQSESCWVGAAIPVFLHSEDQLISFGDEGGNGVIVASGWKRLWPVHLVRRMCKIYITANDGCCM